MSDGVYKPNNIGRVWAIPVPDKVRLSTGEYFNPNAPSTREREEVKDMRPGVLLAQLGGETAEEIGNRILAKANGGRKNV